MKRTFYSEAAYLIGLALLALGAALMERADFGMSMVVAPAYLLHLKLSQYLPFFTFGMAEYTLQAALIIALSLVRRRLRARYLFSFVTAVLYGFMLDGAMLAVSLIPTTIALRALLFVCGALLCSVGVSLLFHTYIPPEAYELFVKEIAFSTGRNINRVKTVYDCVSCLAAIAMSFAFFGLWHFEGVKLGTALCALVNGTLIGCSSKFFEKRFEFRDALPYRARLEEREASDVH